MDRHYEVIAWPQGPNAELFPEMVVAVEGDRQRASRKAWDLQLQTTSDACLYGVRTVVGAES